MNAGAIEAVERILNRGGDDADVLRAVADALHERGVAWIAIRAGGGETTAGTRADARRIPILYAGEHVGELEAAVDDEAFLQRVAVLISAHVQRRSSGEPWAP